MYATIIVLPDDCLLHETLSSKLVAWAPVPRAL